MVCGMGRFPGRVPGRVAVEGLGGVAGADARRLRQRVRLSRRERCSDPARCRPPVVDEAGPGGSGRDRLRSVGRRPDHGHPRALRSCGRGGLAGRSHRPGRGRSRAGRGMRRGGGVTPDVWAGRARVAKVGAGLRRRAGGGPAGRRPAARRSRRPAGPAHSWPFAGACVVPARAESGCSSRAMPSSTSVGRVGRSRRSAPTSNSIGRPPDSWATSTTRWRPSPMGRRRATAPGAIRDFLRREKRRGLSVGAPRLSCVSVVPPSPTGNAPDPPRDPPHLRRCRPPSRPHRRPQTGPGDGRRGCCRASRGGTTAGPTQPRPP